MPTIATFKVLGGKGTEQLLTTYGRGSSRALVSGLFLEASKIMLVSKARFVPVDTGNLRASGHVKPPVVSAGRINVVLAYGGTAAPYALKVHENPRAGKTGGIGPQGQRYKTWAKVGQWKYLEVPFKAARRGMPARLAAHMRRNNPPPKKK